MNAHATDHGGPVDDGNALARLRRRDGTLLARRAAADHHKVVFGCIHLFRYPYRRSFLPTPSWIGSLCLRDRLVYATAASTTSTPITITKISIVIGFPFPLLAWAEYQFQLSELELPAVEHDSSLVRKERPFGVLVRP